MSAESRKHLPEVVNAALARSKGPVSRFVARHFRHFNAASLIDAAKAYEAHLKAGGKMLVTLAGAMSTAELGISLAEMIRQGQGARHCLHGRQPRGGRVQPGRPRLLRARPALPRPDRPEDEQALLDRHMNRVTDTCIPEMEAMRRIEEVVLEEWVAADRAGELLFSARVHVQHPAGWKAREVLPDRPKQLLAARGLRDEPADRRARAGRIRRSATCTPPTSSPGSQERAHRPHGDRVHGRTRRAGTSETAESPSIRGGLDRLFPDRRRHRGRFPDLRRPHAPPGPAPHRTCRSGVISARSATRRQATAAIRARCRTRRSPGASLAARRPSSSSSPTPRSWRR